VSTLSENRFDMKFINTFVTIKNDQIFVEITTNSIAFDLSTDIELKTIKSVDMIFR
jgi:hypothetical protein